MTELPAAVSTEGGFIEIFRARKAELGLSNSTCDEILNRASGYTDHYLGKCDKALVSQAFTAFCELFAKEFVPRDNVEAASRMESVWDRRNGSQIRIAHTLSRHLLDRARPAFYQALGHRRAAVLAASRRSEIASKAAKKRWQKWRRERRGRRANA